MAILREEPKECGIWTENSVRDFLSLPFISETVSIAFGPSTVRRRRSRIYSLRIPAPGVLIAHKTQTDPLAAQARLRDHMQDRSF